VRGATEAAVVCTATGTRYCVVKRVNVIYLLLYFIKIKMKDFYFWFVFLYFFGPDLTPTTTTRVQCSTSCNVPVTRVPRDICWIF
jgi:hypothetical protein